MTGARSLATGAARARAAAGAWPGPARSVAGLRAAAGGVVLRGRRVAARGVQRNLVDDSGGTASVGIGSLNVLR
jgi:hypothetical protein